MKKSTIERALAFAIFGFVVFGMAFASMEVAVAGAMTLQSLHFVNIPLGSLAFNGVSQTLPQLRSQLHEIGKKMSEMIEAAEARDNADFTEEEETEYKGYETEARNLKSRIGRIEEKEKREKEAAGLSGTPISSGLSEGEKRDLGKFSFVKAVRSKLNPQQKFDGLEAEMHQEAENEARHAGVTTTGEGVMIPMQILEHSAVRSEKRDVTATGGSGGDQGGVTVQTSVTNYIEALQNRSVLLGAGADLMTGLSGNISMPKEASVYSPSWEGENDAVVESSPTFTNVTLSPKRLGGYIDVSKQLVIQSSSSIENRLRNQIIRGQALAFDRAGINGAGASNEPTGILQDGDVNVVAIGANGGAVTRAHLLELEKNVDVANALYGNLRYISTPSAKEKLRNVKVDAGSGKFIWTDEDKMLAYQAIASNQVPSDLAKGSGTNLSPILFGNFEDCTFAQWAGLEILVDPYTQAMNGLNRMIVNSYVDFAVLRGSSFAAIKDFDPAKVES